MTLDNNEMDFMKKEAPKLIKDSLKEVKRDLRKGRVKKTNINAIYLRGSLDNLMQVLKLMQDLLPVAGCNDELFGELVLVCSEAWSATYAASFPVLNEEVSSVKRMGQNKILEHLANIFQLHGRWLEKPDNNGTAKPSKHRDLAKEIEQYTFKVDTDNKKGEPYRKRLLKKLKVCVEKISSKGATDSLCNKLDRILYDWVSNRHRVNEPRLQEIIAEVLDSDLLKDHKWCPHSQKVFDSAKKAAAIIEAKPIENVKSDQKISAAVKAAQEILRGKNIKKIVLAGGHRKIVALEKLQNTFGPDFCIDWVQCTKELSIRLFIKRLEEIEADLIVTLIHYSGKKYTRNAMAIARRRGSRCINLTGGYNPNGIAQAILDASWS